MKYGLSEKILNELKNVLDKYENYKFKIFGSRARGDYKDNSDIDIAIFENVPKEDNGILNVAKKTEDEYKIRDEFDKINIIYSIDLVFVDEKIKKELLNSILRDGVDLN